MLRVTHAAAGRMAERDGGSIVSLLGDSGRVGESGILGNICRCTGYAGIVDAVRQAAIAIRG